MFLFTAAATVLFYISMVVQVQAGPHEKNLLNHLFSKDRPLAHNIMERPVKNDSLPLTVEFKVTLQQIIDVDEKNQILNTNLWLDMKWNDYQFVWDPKDYGGIQTLYLPHDKVWKPDILMYNSADEKFDGTYPTNVVVYSNGNMMYVPPGMFKSTCNIDITWYPFDTQNCQLKFGSWSYDGGSIDLKLQCPDNNKTERCHEEGYGDTKSFMENGEWELKGTPAKRNIITYDCCSTPYYDIILIITIRRRTLYYRFNLILPCVLISTMALLTFSLPPDAGEKISLGVTILLSLTVFMMMVAEMIPPTSRAVPLIGMYFACIMMMCSLSVVFTVLVLNYHHRTGETHKIPYWIKQYICNWLARIMWMKREVGSAEVSTAMMGHKYGSIRGHDGVLIKDAASTVIAQRSSKSLLANVLDLEDDFRLPAGVSTSRIEAMVASQHNLPHHCQPPTYANCVTDVAVNHQACKNIAPTSSTSQHYCSMRGELSDIVRELRYITDKIKNDEANNAVAEDWKFAARVVDRFCLVMFTLFTVISTCSILFSPKDVFQ